MRLSRQCSGSRLCRLIAGTGLLAVLMLGVSSGIALTIDGGSARDNARFYTGSDRDFQWEAYDWSGVGRSSDGHWATMISDTYFLSANHYHPEVVDGATIEFWPGNDAGTSYTYALEGGQQIVGDIWLGWLTEPLNPADGITTYPLLMLDTLGAYLGLDVLLYGGAHYVGANEIGGFTTSATGYFDVLYPYDDPHIPYEAIVTGGDSGAPTFVPYKGSLALVGTHWYWYDLDGDKIPHGSGDPFLPYYAGDIQNVMVGESLTFVPEPGSVWLLLVSLLAAGGGRRRG